MSQASLENEIVYHLRRQLKNPKITKNWIQEWCTTKDQVEKNLQPGDQLIDLKAPGMNIFVAIQKPKPRKKPTV